MKALLLLSEDQDPDADDALTAINRALSSLGMTNLTAHLNQDNNERRRGNNDDDDGARRIADDGDDEGDDEATEQQAPSKFKIKRSERRKSKMKGSSVYKYVLDKQVNWNECYSTTYHNIFTL